MCLDFVDIELVTPAIWLDKHTNTHSHIHCYCWNHNPSVVITDIYPYICIYDGLYNKKKWFKETRVRALGKKKGEFVFVYNYLSPSFLFFFFSGNSSMRRAISRELTPFLLNRCRDILSTVSWNILFLFDLKLTFLSGFVLSIS